MFLKSTRFLLQAKREIDNEVKGLIEETKKRERKNTLINYGSYNSITNPAIGVDYAAAVFCSYKHNRFNERSGMISEFLSNNPHIHVNSEQVYIEHNVSHCKPSYERKAIINLITKAKRHEFDILIVSHMYEISRNVHDLMRVVEIIRKNNIGIIVLDSEDYLGGVKNEFNY